MWNAYSASFLRHNKTGNRFILVISFLASMMLSLVSGVFYNLWADQVNQTVAATGSSGVEFTPAVIAYIVVFTIASLALIIMIHHAFAATMTNRIHQLGILQSVGATPRQIKSALVNEVVVLSLPAIIVGNIIGIGLSWAIMAFIISSTVNLRDYTLTFTYHPLVFVGSFGFSMLTAAVSAWIPARKLSRITPLEAIHFGNEPIIKRVRRYRILIGSAYDEIKEFAIGKIVDEGVPELLSLLTSNANVYYAITKMAFFLVSVAFGDMFEGYASDLIAIDTNEIHRDVLQILKATQEKARNENYSNAKTLEQLQSLYI